MEPVTNNDGKKGFYSESTGFVGIDQMQKVTNAEGKRGYYSESTGFVPEPSVNKVSYPESVKSDIKSTGASIVNKVAEYGTKLAATGVGVSRGAAAGAPLGPYGAIAGGILGGGMAAGLTESLARSSKGETLTGANLLSDTVSGSMDAMGLVQPAQKVPAAVAAGARAVKQGFFPKPTPDEAIRQVLQSKGQVGSTIGGYSSPGTIEQDVAKGWKAFAAIKTEGNKKFVDTVAALRKGVEEYSGKVDVALSKDPTVYSMNALATVQKTKGGTKVGVNFIDEALTQLEELYTKVSDPMSAANIKELRIKATANGLTKKEVNDIARLYGIEQNAFNPTTGAAPTNVTKQGYENVRKGLKEVSRRGMGREVAELDETISAMLNTERLLKQNAAASMKLQQKYAERGWGDKAGGVILDAINIASLGSIKGALRKAFPSNVGLKTRNAAEIEGKLSRNLEIINKELVRLGESPMLFEPSNIKQVGKIPGVLFEMYPGPYRIPTQGMGQPAREYPRDFGYIKKYGELEPGGMNLGPYPPVDTTIPLAQGNWVIPPIKRKPAMPARK